jgi:O-antigen/teichoic acid export membrane protein
MLEQKSLNAIDKPIRLSLRVNFAWTFVGNVIYAASQWGVLVVLAKVGSPEMVGQFALGLAITAPIMLFSNLSLRAVQATDVRHEFLLGNYLSLRIITTLLAVVSIGLISLVSGYRSETIPVIMAIGLAKAFESISDVLYGQLQQRERMDRIAVSMIIKGVLTLAVLVVSVVITRSALGAALALAITWAAVLVAYDTRSAALVSGESDRRLAWEPLKPIWNWPILRHLVVLALPLGFTQMLVSLNTNIPRYFIERLWGERELGFFAAIASLMAVGNTLINALGQAASPRLAQYYASGNITAFKHLLGRLLWIGAGLGAAGLAVAVVSGQPLLTLIYRAEYAAYNDVLSVMMLGAAISYIASFLGYGMTAARYFKIQVPVLIACVMSSFVTCLILVPAYGIVGAMWSICLSVSLQVLVTAAIFLRVILGIQRTKHCATVEA